ncbi:MAG: hypothetical protein ISS80_06450 [Candidatus Cloacimonetes bacterium]|nr:hypothetical protein [Candidatus Cloacimonadota bacterium]
MREEISLDPDEFEICFLQVFIYVLYNYNSDEIFKGSGLDEDQKKGNYRYDNQNSSD